MTIMTQTQVYRNWRGMRLGIREYDGPTPNVTVRDARTKKVKRIESPEGVIIKGRRN